MSEMKDPLKELEKHLSAGESIPLSWVVANDRQFPALWKASEDPKIMLIIATYVVEDRDELVLLAAKIASTAPRMPIAAKAVIDLAKEWAESSWRNKLPPSIDDVREAAREAGRIAIAVSYDSNNASEAAYAASRVAWIAVCRSSLLGTNAGRLVRHAIDAWKFNEGYGIRKGWPETIERRLARIIRKELAGEVTIEKIVAAAKEARR